MPKGELTTQTMVYHETCNGDVWSWEAHEAMERKGFQCLQDAGCLRMLDMSGVARPIPYMPYGSLNFLNCTNGYKKKYRHKDLLSYYGWSCQLVLTKYTPASRVLPNSLTEELSNQAARTTWPGLLSRGDTSPTTILYLLLMAE
jgi:hypothetical protein